MIPVKGFNHHSLLGINIAHIVLGMLIVQRTCSAHFNKQSVSCSYISEPSFKTRIYVYHLRCVKRERPTPEGRLSPIYGYFGPDELLHPAFNRPPKVSADRAKSVDFITAMLARPSNPVGRLHVHTILTAAGTCFTMHYVSVLPEMAQLTTSIYLN